MGKVKFLKDSIKENNEQFYPGQIWASPDLKEVRKILRIKNSKPQKVTWEEDNVERTDVIDEFILWAFKSKARPVTTFLVDEIWK
uniref:Uncharacterized protein n=1 Tax=Dictyoglomus turgidum TaxID=513050 RepID=A0A7C3WR74_9BACT